jgi:hypothetical protein
MSMEPEDTMPVKCSLCDLFTWEPTTQLGPRLCPSCVTTFAADEGLCVECGVEFSRSNPQAKDSPSCFQCASWREGHSVEVADPNYDPSDAGHSISDAESPSMRSALRDAGRMP